MLAKTKVRFTFAPALNDNTMQFKFFLKKV